MSVESRLDVSSKRIAEFCRRHRVRSLAVFGSVLRDDFRPDSDVDLLVEFESDAEIGFMALSRMRRELSELLGRPVDLVPRQGLKPRIRESVLSDAETLYAA
ncbi:MAG: nucleotidyltransferase family protein [Anaerolineales bacterium]